MATTKVTTDVTDLSGDTGGLTWSKGTTAQRPGSPSSGELRVNTETKKTEVYNGTEWRNLKIAPPPSINVDYLVVAGGGAGGISYGGGGGAGGLRTSYGSTTGGGGSAENTLSLFLGTSYTVTVGAGGASKTGSGSGNAANFGNDGEDSIFGTITSTGGGGGSAFPNGSPYSTLPGRDGGSGGGAAMPYSQGSSAIQGGSAVTSPAVQGYAGGQGSWFSTGGQYSSPGGGGGANSVGSNGANTATGASGGSGLSVSITGSPVTYAGGGGAFGSQIAGPGGSGVGGDGGYGPNYVSNFSWYNGNPGTANTGSGGGGATDGNNNSSGAGGSGIIVLRTSVSSATFTSGVTCNGTSGGGTINGVLDGSDYVYSITAAGATDTVTF